MDAVIKQTEYAVMIIAARKVIRVMCHHVSIQILFFNEREILTSDEEKKDTKFQYYLERIL